LWSFAGSMPKEISNELKTDLENGWCLMNFIGEENRCIRGSSIPNSHRYELKLEKLLESHVIISEVLCLILSSITFGAIHFGAINSTFPSHTEKIIWCVASTVCTSAIILALLGGLVAVLFDKFLTYFSSTWELSEWLFRSWFLFITLLYILARVFLIIELFRCLFFLLPSAFVATWVSSVPHVS
jgi:hypothetical protein